MELIEILLKVFGREMPVIVLWIAVSSVRVCRKFFLDFASGGFCEMMSLLKMYSLFEPHKRDFLLYFCLKTIQIGLTSNFDANVFKVFS